MRRLGLRPGGGASRTYGATTLEARHVRLLDDGRVEFNFLGKAGMRYKRIVDDPDIRRVVEKRLKGKSPNDRLFSTDEKRANDYLDRAFGSNEFNVKDLRTLHANVLALRKIKSMRPPKNKKEYKAAVAAVVKHVAQALNNKPAVAKKDYIDPTVFAEWEEVNV
jgi:DNA topoisomerase IB